MIHYSCDRCKRMLDPEEDVRYVVRLEVQAAMEPIDLEESDDDRDHLMEIQEILEGLDDSDDAFAEEVSHKRRYDLCGECYRQYIKNPVGREIPASLGFSQN